MPRCRLEFSACLTVTQFKALPNPHSGNWWIARKTKNGLKFLKGISKIAGYHPFSFDRDIARGDYVIGCGTSFRHHFKVR